jgi:cephalosporin hydroxylase
MKRMEIKRKIKELKAYANLTSLNSYCVVFDTLIEDMDSDMYPDRSWGPGNNPKTAVREYLQNNDTFILDETIQNKIQKVY